MRAAVLREYGAPLSIEEVDRPTPAAHGVVVDVEACGICRSDWHAWQGHGEWADDHVDPGQILGHEPAGTIVDVGADVDEHAVGDQIAIPFSLGDGTCYYCQNGHGEVCTNGYALGFQHDAQGAFAEYVHVPHADYNATTLPDGLSTRAAAAMGCRFTTAFHALQHQIDVDAGDWLAVHGCGGLGLSTVQIAAAMGANVVAVDLRGEALDFAHDLGAAATVDATDEDPDAVAAAVRAHAGGAGCHVSVDALGASATCRASVRSLRPLGTHVQLGLTGDDDRGEIALPTDWMNRQEVAFVGSRGMPPSRYDEVFRFVTGGHADPSALVTREVALADVPDRLAAMTDYGTLGVEVVTDF
jgi:alcohol dehydrogenase